MPTPTRTYYIAMYRRDEHHRWHGHISPSENLAQNHLEVFFGESGWETQIIPIELPGGDLLPPKHATAEKVE